MPRRIGSQNQLNNYGRLVAALLALHFCYMAKVYYDFDSHLPKQQVDIGNLPPTHNNNGQQKTNFVGKDSEQVNLGEWKSCRMSSQFSQFLII